METAHAENLAASLSAVPEVQARMAHLQANTADADRSLIVFANLPRVGLKDIETNNGAIRATIDYTHDKSMRKPLLVQHAMHELDRRAGFLLSAQQRPSHRSEWHRWEGDKLRLLYAYFLKQLDRSKFSYSLPVFHLKVAHQQRPQATYTFIKCYKCLCICIHVVACFTFQCILMHFHTLAHIF